MDMKPVIYREYREKLRAGDVVLYRPGRWELINRRIASKAVHEEAEPWQRYAHAGMVGWAQGVCELLEMLQFRGGRCTRLSWQVKGWSGQWDVYRPIASDEWFDGEPSGYAASRVMRQITGTPYGYGSLWTASVGYLPIVGALCPPPRDDAADSRIEAARHCSQAVSFGWRRAGSDPIADLADAVTTPNHLAWPHWSRYLATIVWTAEQEESLRQRWPCERMAVSSEL